MSSGQNPSVPPTGLTRSARVSSDLDRVGDEDRRWWDIAAEDDFSRRINAASTDQAARKENKKRRRRLKNVDIVSYLIDRDVCELVDRIFFSLDSHSLQACESVCPSWLHYIRHRRIWQRMVYGRHASAPVMAELNDWWPGELPEPGIIRKSYETEEDIARAREFHWRMISLPAQWRQPAKCRRSSFSFPVASVFTFLQNGNTRMIVNVSTARENGGDGFKICLFEEGTHNLLHWKMVTKEDSTVLRDRYCVGSSNNLIAVGSAYAKRVWIFAAHKVWRSVGGAVIRKARVVLNTLDCWGGSTRFAATQPVGSLIKLKDFGVNASVAAVSIHPTRPTVALFHPNSHSYRIFCYATQTTRQSVPWVRQPSRLLWNGDILICYSASRGKISTYDYNSRRALVTEFGNSEDGGITTLDAHKNMYAIGRGSKCSIHSIMGSSPTFYFKPHRTKISTVRLTDSVVLTASEFTTIKIWDLYSLLKTPIQKGAELLARIKFDLLPLRILDLRFWSDTKLGVITLSGADRICNDRYVQFRDVSIPCPKFNPAKESELGPDAASNYYARARASRDTETGWWDSEEEVEQNGGTPLEIELQDMVL